MMDPALRQIPDVRRLEHRKNEMEHAVGTLADLFGKSLLQLARTEPGAAAGLAAQAWGVLRGRAPREALHMHEIRMRCLTLTRHAEARERTVSLHDTVDEDGPGLL